MLEEDLGEYSYADMLTKENYQKLYNPAIKTLIHISNINHPKNISTDSNPHYLKNLIWISTLMRLRYSSITIGPSFMENNAMLIKNKNLHMLWEKYIQILQMIKHSC